MFEHGLKRLSRFALGRILLAGGIIACRTVSSAGDAPSSDSSCDPEGPGTLRVANSSGRLLDVYVARTEGMPQLLTQVSSGTSSITVPGPTDLGARYDVVDPIARQRLATVDWLRRTAQEISTGVVVELTCFTRPLPLSRAAHGSRPIALVRRHRGQ